MTFSKNNIKHRLVKYVADLWGYQQADMDGFDPLIDLLLGACAVEFERTGQQIISSQNRILEKLAQLLLPESLTIPQPAHTVVHARAVEPEYVVKAEDQFSFDKEVINPARPTEINKTPIFFSPTFPVSVYDAAIQYVGVGNRLLAQADVNLREPVATTKRGKNFPKQTLWLGIKLNPASATIPQLGFFFDWRNNPDKQKYFNLLPVTRFSVNENVLDCKSGFSEAAEDWLRKSRNTLVQEWEVLPKIEDKVNQLYQHHFLTLKPTEFTIKENTSNYPETFAEHFEADVLKSLKNPLVWFKIEMSQLIPQEAVEEMICAINSFPACNRKLIDNRRPYRLDESLNIIPLQVDDYFLSINEVTSGDGKDFQAVPFFNIHQMEAGTFALRDGRVGKFNSRNAHEMLQYVLEMMRDESAAFAAIGGAIGSKDILELEQNLNKIENNLTRKSGGQDVDQYLMLKPGKSREVYLSYWSTAGALGNQIPAGSTLKTRSIDIKSNSVATLTTSFGGKNKPSEQEKLYAFRSSLLSRDRMVTKEDIKAACFAELGDVIEHVEVQKGCEIGASENNGLMRVLDVFLTPSREEELTTEEWAKICNELALSLGRRSSYFLPIRVRMSKEVPA